MQNVAFYRPTFAEIDLKTIELNILNLRHHLKDTTTIIAVVKADGYGHGAKEVATVAIRSGAKFLAVATPDEALELRSAIPEAPILVLGASPVSFAEVAATHNIHVTVFQKEWLEQVPKLMHVLHVHVKVDTGMGRLGIRDENELDAMMNVFAARNDVDFYGIFTHFAKADEEKRQFTEQQTEKFQQMVDRLPVQPKMIHAANSAAALIDPARQFDAVRYGIAMYGIAPSEFVGQHVPFELQPAYSLHTELVQVKKVPSGTPISYGGTYVTKHEEWIGTLPIGYADGLLRKLSGMDVLIQGRRMPIIGRICMDQCMVKLDREIPVGEKVTLIGTQGDETISVEAWAEQLETIPYEIPCLIKPRIVKVYK